MCLLVLSCGLTSEKLIASFHVMQSRQTNTRTLYKLFEGQFLPQLSKNYLVCSSAHGAPARGEGKRSPRARIKSVSSLDNVAGGSMRTTA